MEQLRAVGLGVTADELVSQAQQRPQAAAEAQPSTSNGKIRHADVRLYLIVLLTIQCQDADVASD